MAAKKVVPSKGVRRTDGSSQRAESQRQGQMRRPVPVDRMASQRREAAAMAVKPQDLPGPVGAMFRGQQYAQNLIRRELAGPPPNTSVGAVGNWRTAAANVAAAVGRQFVGRPGDKIGSRIAQSVERDLIDRINLPAAAGKIARTTKNVYTESGMFRGKDVFLESLPKTDEMMDAIIKGQFTRAARTSAMVGRHAAGAAKEGIKVGLAVGGAAGAAGAAVVNKLFGRDDKKKGK